MRAQIALLLTLLTSAHGMALIRPLKNITAAPSIIPTVDGTNRKIILNKAYSLEASVGQFKVGDGLNTSDYAVGVFLFAPAGPLEFKVCPHDITQPISFFSLFLEGNLVYGPTLIDTDCIIIKRARDVPDVYSIAVQEAPEYAGAHFETGLVEAVFSPLRPSKSPVHRIGLRVVLGADQPIAATFVYEGGEDDAPVDVLVNSFPAPLTQLNLTSLEYYEKLRSTSLADHQKDMEKRKRVAEARKAKEEAEKAVARVEALDA